TPKDAFLWPPRGFKTVSQRLLSHVVLGQADAAPKSSDSGAMGPKNHSTPPHGDTLLSPREFKTLSRKTRQLLSLAVSNQSKNLAQRFRVRKAGGFGLDESPFGVRCPTSDEKSGEIWPKADLS
ncbi:MAG TPA: hypothetical protein PKD78_12170, partial [Saprospiraceae bacterium]|nr:hypothetical protein [Saprospiraceae bacterium]